MTDDAVATSRQAIAELAELNLLTGTHVAVTVGYDSGQLAALVGTLESERAELEAKEAKRVNAAVRKASAAGKRSVEEGQKELRAAQRSLKTAEAHLNKNQHNWVTWECDVDGEFYRSITPGGLRLFTTAQTDVAAAKKAVRSGESSVKERGLALTNAVSAGEVVDDGHLQAVYEIDTLLAACLDARAAIRARELRVEAHRLDVRDGIASTESEA